jgi:regulatory protein
MPRRITALRKNPDGRTVNVELDGAEAFGLWKNAAAGLQPGRTLEPDEIDRLKSESRLEDAYARCLGLMARRPRSRTEIERYLRGRKMADAEASAVLARLVDRGWIDDRGFARTWVENRQAFRPRSARMLLSELRKFGIPEEEARAAVEGMEEGKAALDAARKKAPRLERAVAGQPRARLEFLRKMAAHLASRGFDFELSRETARSVWEELSRPAEAEEK